ncbi:hypothetical protein NLU13_0215 [Sarocladium strictum]|uniref:Aminoglycoside phosphotransferase domain-containing protein n=1 Tax=Sarocladium strictum TaxID=5046 RepID=A0AA39GNN6_SARSR|nr:hypothetical protein NLU13_0215 [Sarocladium strictum]
MPFWTCDFQGCERPTVRKDGDCTLCDRHLCARHLGSPFHDCPKWEDADVYDSLLIEADENNLQKLLDRINTRALAARASSLRQGIACSIPSLHHETEQQPSAMGGMNIHLDVIFEDGVTWIVRIRKFDSTSPPAAVRDHIFRSEVATLKFLEEIDIPTPKVHGFGLEGDADNDTGVGYMFMDKMPGKALKWDFNNETLRGKVIEQLADVFIELQKQSFASMGSLHEAPGDAVEVGPFAHESLSDIDEAGRMLTSGPFLSLQESLTSEINFILDLITREEMYTPQMAVDSYLVHRFLLDLIPRIFPHFSGGEEAGDVARFYLKHADDKGDHILVDDDYNITGIIDWEWAKVVPAEVAFNSPLALLRVDQFYSGCVEMCEEERLFADTLEGKGHLDLAEHVRRGRLVHFFTFCCCYNLSADFAGFEGLFRGLRDAACVDGGMDWEEWRTVALARYEDDEGLKKLRAK